MSLSISLDSVRSRYTGLLQQMREQFPSNDGHCVVTSTGVATQPFDGDYEKADLYLGSHIDDNPGSEDKIYVMSYHPEPSGGETILDECFTERLERPHLFSSKSQILHVYARKFHSPGGTLLEAALASIDLHTGELLRNQTGAQACQSIDSLGLDQR